MKWRCAVGLAVSGVVAFACARGSDASEPEDPATALDPTRPMGADADALADGEAGSSPVTEGGAGDGPVVPAQPDAGAGTFVNGSASGVSIAPAHGGVVLVGTATHVERVVIAIKTRPGFCADYTNGIDRAGDHTLIIAVIAKGTAWSVAAATYTIGTGKASSAGGIFDSSGRILAYDAQCQTMVAPSKESAISGTVTLTQVGTAAVVGTFSLTFPGGQLTGVLDAAVCTAAGAHSFTCMP